MSVLSTPHRASRSADQASAPTHAETQGAIEQARTPFARHATVRWMGHPPGGEPRLTVGSHSLTPAPTLNVDLQVPHPLATSPAELLAGGFAVILAKLAADALARAHTPATELVVDVAFRFADGDAAGEGIRLRAIRCTLEGRGELIDQARLAEVGQQALGQTMDALAMRAEAVSVGLDVSVVGGQIVDPPPGDGHESRAE